jgi:hypothetical protein
MGVIPYTRPWGTSAQYRGPRSHPHTAQSSAQAHPRYAPGPVPDRSLI